MKAIVLAGGNDQIALLKLLRERDIYTILIDFNKEPIAKPFADKHFEVSTMDYSAVVSIAKSEKVDFILTVCTDQALLIAAKASEQLGLYFPISFKMAQNLTNKKWMKQVLTEVQLPTAKYSVSSDVKNLELDRLSFPLVFKPVDSNSSKGVIKAKSMEDVHAAFTYAKSFSRSGVVICEEFISGEEISIDAFIVKSRAHLLLVSKSEKLQGIERRDFPIHRSIAPYSLSNKLEIMLVDILQKIADAFCIIDSPLLVQAIVNEDGINIIELSARTGGGSKYALIEEITGFNVIQGFLKIIFHENLSIRLIQNPRNYVMQYIYTIPGMYLGQEGFDYCLEKKIIDNVFFYKKEGTHISGNTNSSDRIAGVLFSGKTTSELNEKIAQFDNSIKILNDSQADIFIHGLPLLGEES